MSNSDIKLLEVGAGKFSFLHAFVQKKHRNGQAIPEITATEYVSEEDACKLDKKTLANIKSAKFFAQRYNMPPVKLLFNVDATKLHLDDRLEDRYHAIRFNMPHNRSRFATLQLQNMIRDFFLSASQKQQEGDKIYLVIPQAFSGDKKQPHYYPCYYGIYQASVNSSYKLLAKRKFSEVTDEKTTLRYPGYEHTKTNDSEAASSAINAREYVYIKTSILPEELRKVNSPKRKRVYELDCEYPKEVDTASESDDDDFNYLRKAPRLDDNYSTQEYDADSVKDEEITAPEPIISSPARKRLKH